MASLGGNITPPDVDSKLIFAGLAVLLSAAIGITKYSSSSSSSAPAAASTKTDDSQPSLVRSVLLFCYSCFIKPHRSSAKGSQQDALESFYETQAGVYDVTRKTLLKGREDMLALVAAQLAHRWAVEDAAAKKIGGSNNSADARPKRIWVDVGGGTGWNIEAMAAHVDVPNFFSSVYLVDFSPSLCAVARKRFARLGWTNVHVICEDARKFRLEDYESGLPSRRSSVVAAAASPAFPGQGYFSFDRPDHGGADLITMSYSLSMIPDYYSVVDSLSSLLAPNGILGAIDFYVQSKADFSFRNYTGGLVNRHTSFLGRTFWRSWFELDRVSLDASRRDYLEYRFGTVLSVNSRNYSLGSIPYYIWLGCHKKPFHVTSLPHEVVERIDAMVTESPYLHGNTMALASSGGRSGAYGTGSAGGRPIPPPSPATTLSRAVQRTAPEIRSKAFQTAIANLSANLPLPAFFYQNHHWRIYYDDQLPKHTQFRDEYIYAFTWEDTRVDERLLKLNEKDVVLAITSAGDNILSYALQSPARIHAVDLNPAQNHLLELKVAAYTAQIPYEDFWLLFGAGKHPGFRELLITKLSPHLSSRGFQYWLRNERVFTKAGGRGLYDTGGSKNAIRLFRYLSYAFGLRRAVAAMLAAKTLNEQREIWRAKIRPALLSRTLSHLVVSQESFLWAALGVPKNQLAMIEADHASDQAASNKTSSRSSAVWEYMVNTLDPMVETVHMAADNPYYYVCMDGQYARRCHPDYLAPQAHARLSRPGAFDGLRIHTDEIEEVIARLTPGSLTVAVVMDSMDWFDPEDNALQKTNCPSSETGGAAAASQIAKLNRALALGGRVLLRSSARTPWYIAVFERLGFSAKQHGNRTPGVCIDRVNMYASCWICTKVAHLPPPTPGLDGDGLSRRGSSEAGGAAGEIDKLVI
ncbi:3-amino-3-carboxypropyl transferase [Sporothrix schenckii 1099-18]|uniref:3-amino-3-carboxypropyl transferase n=1 Tax=Sporothrix schenckii 1099-18 TaxID=1397361 RepID=A0A0F2LWG0_SPOSC|nr:3-amino-3-carboxypropyl transferase [Sporothrix schenckii 1099-18]KJR81793.1 3-amino-3-carboxypropyl transferase [Sporothrix schenckii 1099-18]